MCNSNQDIFNERREIARRLLQEDISFEIIARAVKMDAFHLLALKREVSGQCMMNDWVYLLHVLNDTQTAEAVMRIIMGREDIYVKETALNYNKLDIYAVDATGKQHDCSIRLVRINYPDHEKEDETIYNPSVASTHDGPMQMTDIILTDLDMCGYGWPKYTVHWKNRELSWVLDDWPQTIHVNCLCEDQSHALGKLIHDFWCVHTQEMYYEFLRKRADQIRIEMQGGI